MSTQAVSLTIACSGTETHTASEQKEQHAIHQFKETGSQTVSDRIEWQAYARRLGALPRKQQILHAVRVHPGLSKSQLARMLGVSPARAGAIVDEFQRSGLIVSRGRHNGTGGRPSERLGLNDTSPLVLGVHVHRSGIRLGVLNLAGRFLDKVTVPYRPSSRHAEIDSVVNAVHTAVQRYSPVGVGVAAPGLVDPARGVVHSAVNFGWDEVPLHRLLAAAVDVPVTVARGTVAVALAEDWWGNARAADPVIFAAFGAEVGIAIRVGDDILQGAIGSAGEFGHIPVAASGPRCGCGRRGCLEAVASTVALRRRDHALSNRSGHQIQRSVSEIMAAAEEGDPAARQSLTEVGGYIGIGTSILVNLLNPQLIVFSGELMEAAPFILPIVRRAVHDRALPQLAAAAEFQVSRFDDDGPLLGAATLALDALFRRLAPV